MGKLIIDRYEADLDGGWYVQVTDLANLDGYPLTMYVHLNEEWLEEMIEQRRYTYSPTDLLETALDRLRLDVSIIEAATGITDTLAQKTELGIPALEDPLVIIDFLRAYEEHINDCIDRINLDITGGASYAVLQDARANLEVPDKSQRTALTNTNEFQQFISNDANAEIPALGIGDTIFPRGSYIAISNTAPFAFRPKSSTIGTKTPLVNIEQKFVVVPNNAKMETQSDGVEPYSEYPRPKDMVLTPQIGLQGTFGGPSVGGA